MQYVESNPVRAGLVDENAAYRWSSAAAHQTGPDSEEVPLLDWNFWRGAGGARCWKRHMQPDQDVRQVRALRECAYSGKPFGNEDFVSDLERRFNRKCALVADPRPRQKSIQWGRSSLPLLANRELGPDQAAFIGRLSVYVFVEETPTSCSTILI